VLSDVGNKVARQFGHALECHISQIA